MKFILWALLTGWMCVSILLHLAPPPGRWGDWAYPLMKIYGKYHQEIQLFAHAVMMGVFAFILMLLLPYKPRYQALVQALGLTLIFAITMELMQGMLPYGFQRECDPADLLPAMGGALAGCMAGLGLSRSKE